MGGVVRGGGLGSFAAISAILNELVESCAYPPIALKNMINFWPFGQKKTQVSLSEGHVIYAVGDVHGRLDCLDTILARIDSDRTKHTGYTVQEVFLGDYVDRGMQSSQVIDRLIARRELHGAILLRGNHEQFMHGALHDESAAGLWCQFGGLETMRSYGVEIKLPLSPQSFGPLHRRWLEAVPQRHRSFLDSLPLHHRQDDYFFCHAGVRPGVPFDKQEPDDLMGIRDEFLSSPKWHGACVVHGHTPVEEPELLPNRINVDTGAYITGRLSCVRLKGQTQTILSA